MSAALHYCWQTCSQPVPLQNSMQGAEDDLPGPAAGMIPGILAIRIVTERPWPYAANYTIATSSPTARITAGNRSPETAPEPDSVTLEATARRDRDEYVISLRHSG